MRAAAVRSYVLQAGVLVERMPRLSKLATELEVKFRDLSEQLEIERSRLSNHEMQIKEEAAATSKPPVSLLELESDWRKELGQFEPASRLTEADKSGDLKSLDRKLDSKLMLLVRQKYGGDSMSPWILPSVRHRQGETMRETADRAISELFSSSAVRILGNAPWAVHQHLLMPENELAKLFIFKAYIAEESDLVPSDEHVAEHLWLTHQEAGQKLAPSFRKSLRPLLYE